MTTSNEHNNAPAVPMHRIADFESDEISDMRPGRAYREGWNACREAMLAATPAPAPAQYKDSTPHLSVGESSFESWFGEYNPANKGSKQQARDAYAAGMGDPLVSPAPAQEVPSDPNGWCQYVAGMVFCWLQMQEGLGLTSYDEDRFVEAIAGIVQRRLWAYTPAHPEPVTLTDEQKTWAVNKLMEQAQVFASAWSLVGGKFDFGNALDEAEQAKTELRSMVIAALRAKGGK